MLSEPLSRSLNGSDDHQAISVAPKEEYESNGWLGYTHPLFPALFFVPRLSYILAFLTFAGLIAGACLISPIENYLDKYGLGWETLLEYASIPFVSLVFTYFHIWWALWMTFYPVKFFGCWQIPYTNVGFPLGWQGIVPFKAEKMARTAVRLMTEELIDITEVFSRVDPVRFVQSVGPSLRNHMKNLVHNIAEKHYTEGWNVLPQAIKDEIVQKAYEDCPATIHHLMHDFKLNITKCFDLEHMVVENLMAEPNLINDMFIACGWKELIVIRNCGGFMGLFFGFVQMIIYHFLPDSAKTWFLPVFAGVIGAITNWIALTIIFKPVNPIKFPCGNLQGLFLKRQDEVAREYSRMVASRILTTEKIIDSLMSGPATDNLFVLVQNCVGEAVDTFAGGRVKSMFEWTVGSPKYEALKADFTRQTNDMFPLLMLDAAEYTESAMDIETTLREEMSALDSKSFEGLLHPVFKEDEWKLIAIGGVLGVVIGVFQTYALALN
mmetsp:Transcript_46809/g.92114  ORF Transcript_46809/g.92114 Transcript_46809/m.92114 type:complete len:494 (+) Transcript_46809:87-1568(+)|eukprot:CAMPEP_0175120552 /NCGR_PEP_ID=MMETSP0087-20121206/685_1 /TAXON_ID=136419 /ORGANISM="Unknown Unknown, Strain D1" /LENGTH=493 /DNA_ID=CAMNT_0016402013 /DNA_START=87 /DNA_END=1568 /DNA_ORIENTATION=-